MLRRNPPKASEACQNFSKAGPGKNSSGNGMQKELKRGARTKEWSDTGTVTVEEEFTMEDSGWRSTEGK